jgi:hypothetical protein
MRWRLYLGVGVVAAASIALVVVAIASVTGGSELERVKSALRLQTNCARIAVRRPSRAVIVNRWAGATVQSADVACEAAGPRVVYAKFNDRGGLDRAVATNQPAGSYCVLGNAVLIAGRVGAASTILSDMCQSLGGRLVIPAAD